jgi:hypothetical protein
VSGPCDCGECEDCLRVRVEKLSERAEQAERRLEAIGNEMLGDCQVGPGDYAWSEHLRRVRELRRLLDTPEIIDFAKAVQLEAAHQRKRWGSDHDDGKTDADWFWLIGFLGGKALHNPGPFESPGHRRQQQQKQLHRIITIAAAAANWHAAKLGATDMRPGIATPEGEQP